MIFDARAEATSPERMDKLMQWKYSRGDAEGATTHGL